MPPSRKRPQKTSLAGAAGDQVRAIIEAAETSAAQIRAEAEEDADRIRGEARAETRALLDSLRSGVERLAAELGIAQEEGRAVSAVAAARAVEVPAPPPELEASASAPSDDEPDFQLAEDAAVGLDEAEEPPAGPPSRAEPEPALAPSSAADSDLESARLVALNMALDGTPREEVDRYLSENFALVDRAALLDEVFSSVGR